MYSLSLAEVSLFNFDTKNHGGPVLDPLPDADRGNESSVFLGLGIENVQIIQDTPRLSDLHRRPVALSICRTSFLQWRSR